MEQVGQAGHGIYTALQVYIIMELLGKFYTKSKQALYMYDCYYKTAIIKLCGMEALALLSLCYSHIWKGHFLFASIVGQYLAGSSLSECCLNKISFADKRYSTQSHYTGIGPISFDS